MMGQELAAYDVGEGMGGDKMLFAVVVSHSDRSVQASKGDANLPTWLLLDLFLPGCSPGLTWKSKWWGGGNFFGCIKLLHSLVGRYSGV